MDKHTYIKALKSFNKMYLVFAMAIIILVIVIGGSLAALLDNDVKIKANSDMTYYLTLSYDGVDKNGLESNDTTVSELKSGYLYVEDKIPDGVTFLGFTPTQDGTIGAIKRSDGSVCVGKVIDDTNDNGVWNQDMTEYTYHGLHYNAITRTVSYTVRDLKAGCDLTVGVITKTPKRDTNSNNRRDFYNFATTRDEDKTILSNNVHAFMGDEFGTLYTVSYEYTGDVPNNVEVPISENYISGANVNVPLDIKVDGYTFNGWYSDDVSIVAGKYNMISSNITLKGKFTKKDTHKVEYTIEGIVPSEYILPTTKEYPTDKTIKLDLLKKGTIINGYKFLGWKSNDIKINSNNTFNMPDKDITIIGKFEEVKYNVSYAFYDGTLPPNSKQYLPKTESYYPGETIELSNIDDNIAGYKFLGWYKENKFVMPSDNVVVYGEWKKTSISIDPEISMELTNENTYYVSGDNVVFKITISNTSIFDINEVVVRENNENTYFLESDSYSLLSDHIVSVDTIKTGETVDIYAQYTVSNNDIGIITNEVEIIGACNENGSLLGDGLYKALASFEVMPSIEVCNKVEGYDNKNIFQYNITGDNYETWFTLSNNECRRVYLIPGKYKIKEVLPQEYEIKSVIGFINNNNEEFTIKDNTLNKITYTNKFRYKKFLHSFGRSIGQIIGGE